MKHHETSGPIGKGCGEDARYFRGMLDLLKDGTFMMKPNGDIVDVNKMGCDMLGYK